MPKYDVQIEGAPRGKPVEAENEKAAVAEYFRQNEISGTERTIKVTLCTDQDERTAYEIAGDEAYAAALARGVGLEEAGDIARAAAEKVRIASARAAGIVPPVNPKTEGDRTDPPQEPEPPITPAGGRAPEPEPTMEDVLDVIQPERRAAAKAAWLATIARGGSSLEAGDAAREAAATPPAAPAGGHGGKGGKSSK